MRPLTLATAFLQANVVSMADDIKTALYPGLTTNLVYRHQHARPDNLWHSAHYTYGDFPL